MFENTNHDEIKFKFDLCIDGNIIIDYVERKTGWEWDDICELEKKYRKEPHFDNSDAYPLCELEEEDENTFQYWVDQFIKDYSEEIGDKTVFVINLD